MGGGRECRYKIILPPSLINRGCNYIFIHVVFAESGCIRTDRRRVELPSVSRRFVTTFSSGFAPVKLHPRCHVTRLGARTTYVGQGDRLMTYEVQGHPRRQHRGILSVLPTWGPYYCQSSEWQVSCSMACWVCRGPHWRYPK